MTIRQLEYICALVQEGSYTKAAKKLFISESALSQQISAIEKEYNIKLVDRKKKPFTLTKEGYVVYEASENILTTLKEMEENLANSGKDKLYLKTIDFFSFTLAPKLMALIRYKFPDADLKIIDSESDRLFTGQRYENIDLYLHTFDMMTNTDDFNESDEKFKHIEVGFEEILLATSKSNLRNMGLDIEEDEVDLKLLKNETFVGTSTSRNLEFVHNKFCIEQGGYIPTYVKAEPTIAKLISYLQFNDCWAVVPDTAAKYYNVNPEIRFFKIKGVNFKRQIIISYYQKQKLSPVAKEFIRLTRELLNGDAGE